MASEDSSAKPKITNKQKILDSITSLDPDDDERTTISKIISWILRHGIAKVGLKPVATERAGRKDFVKYDELVKVELLEEYTLERIEEVIKMSNQQKLRYDIKDSPDGKLIGCYRKEERKEKRGADAGAAPATSATATGGTALKTSAPTFVPRTIAYNGYPYSMSPVIPPSPFAYGYGSQMPKTSPNQRMEGRIKSFNSEKGFGFIECTEAHARYGRDVFLHKSATEDIDGPFEVGQEVSFSVELNKQGMPQAKDLKLSDKPSKGGKGKGKKGKGKEGSKEKSKGKGRGG